MTERQTLHDYVNEIIVDFLKGHQWISLNAIETDLGLKTQGILSKAVAGERKIPFHELWPIVLALVPYKLKINGFDCEVDEMTDTLFMTKWIANGEKMDHRDEGGNTTHYTYLMEFVKDMASDISDIVVPTR